MEVWNVWISKKSARVGIYIYATSSIHGLEFELFTFIYFHDVICVSLRRTKRQKLRTTLVHPSLQSIKSLHIKGPISAATTRSLISVINLTLFILIARIMRARIADIRVLGSESLISCKTLQCEAARFGFLPFWQPIE